MKILKWGLFFIASFLISWILITTFSQEQFRQAVSARVFTYRTIAIPIYWYVAGAFAAGLLIGLFVAVYNYINLKHQLRKQNRVLRTLEEERDRLQMQATMNKPSDDRPATRPAGDQAPLSYPEIGGESEEKSPDDSDNPELPGQAGPRGSA